MDNRHTNTTADLIVAAENQLGQRYTYNSIPDIRKMVKFIWNLRKFYDQCDTVVVMADNRSPKRDDVKWLPTMVSHMIKRCQ